MMVTMTLTEFLLARIAEDEASEEVVDLYPVGAGRVRREVSTVAPSARTLRECEAKRKIVAHLVDAQRGVARAARLMERESGSRDAQEAEFAADAKLDAVSCIAKHVAEIYADHADYRDEWKP